MNPFLTEHEEKRLKMLHAAEKRIANQKKLNNATAKKNARSPPVANTGCSETGCAVMGGRSYRATRKNRNLLRKYKAGKKIGFTGRASLKAKGLLPRTSSKYRGKFVMGSKYSGTGKNKMI